MVQIIESNKRGTIINNMADMLELTGVTISFKATGKQLKELDEGKEIHVKVHGKKLKISLE